MRRYVLTLMLGGALAMSAAACGSSNQTVRGETDAPDAAGEGAAGGTTAGGGTTRPGVDVDRNEVIEAKEPVYIKDIDREAQDSFAEGVLIVSSRSPNYKTAEKLFQTAAEKDPSFLEAFFNWGMCLERTGRADAALAVYQKALEANPGDPSASAYIAKIYLAKAKESEDFGKAAEASQWLEKAKGLLDAQVAKDATNVAVNNAMALYFLMKDDLDTAERYVREVLYVQPTNVTGLNTRGLINLKRGKYLIAKWIFENKVLKEDPTSTEALTNLGYTYIKLGLRPLAMKYFGMALEADPENMAVRMNIAALLLEHLDYGGALEHYEKVLVAQPNNLDAKIGRCDALYGRSGTSGDVKASLNEAITCYNAFLRDKPDRADLYKRIAEIYQGKLQDLGKAAEYYELYGKNAKLSPEEAENNRKIVASLRQIIESGGLKAPEEQPLDDGMDGGGMDDGSMDDGSMDDGGMDDGGEG